MKKTFPSLLYHPPGPLCRDSVAAIISHTRSPQPVARSPVPRLSRGHNNTPVPKTQKK